MSLIGTSIGKIRIVKQIGAGGMGEVYLGFDERLKREVVVKSVAGRLRMDAEARARFQREAEVLSGLEHPYVCRVYDIIERDDGDFIVLEHVKGKTLAEIEHDALDLPARLRIAEQIAEALTLAHAKRIVHRDLKPANIMLTERGDVKVLDFGIARVLAGPDHGPASDTESGRPTGVDPEAESTAGDDGTDQNTENLKPKRQPGPTLRLPSYGKATAGDFHTALGAVIGTPKYMSPEQAVSAAVTTASDMYSFGLVLQSLLTGKSPYDPDLPDDMLLEAAAAAHSLDPIGLDSDLTALINRLKSPVPENRPTALDTLDRIRWIREAPARRRRKLLTATMVVLLAAGTVTSSIGFYRAKQEAARAQQETARAEEQASNAIETVNLLREFLSSVDPGKKGKDLKVIELLTAFRPKLDELGNKPRTQAALFATYGTTYGNLGLYDEAFEYTNTAHDIRVREFGREAKVTLATMSELANILRLQGKDAASETLYRECLGIQKRVLGNDHEDTLETMHNLAIVLGNLNRFDEADAMYRQSLAAYVRVKGNEDPDTMKFRANFATLLWKRGEAETAEKQFRELIRTGERTIGKDDPRVLNWRHNLMLTLTSQEKFAEADPMVFENVERFRRVLGEKHPRTLTVMNSAALALKRQGRFAESEEMRHKVLAIQEETLGPDHPSTLFSVGNLASLYSDMGKLVEAERLNRQALEGFRRKFGNEHTITYSVINNLAWTLKARGKLTEAEAMFRQVIDGRTRLLGPNDSSTLSAMGNLASVVSDQGKLAEAERMYAEIVEKETRILGAENSHTLDAVGGAAKNLARAGKFAEAEPMQRSVLEARRRETPTGSPDLVIAMAELATALVQQGKDDEAHALAAEAVSLGTRTETNRQVAEAMNRLGSVIESKGRPEDALACFRLAAKGGNANASSALKRLGEDRS